MCGRFTFATPASQVAELFGLAEVPDLAPRYNIAPTQTVAIVRRAAQGGRELVRVQWGLVPSWAKDPRIGARMINARWETAAVKPAFRAALRSRRCLIPADGFYEWQRLGARKQPYYFCFPDGRPFAMAGVWERFEGIAPPLESCAILTTAADPVVGEVHDRMPVILDPADFERWLDPTVATPDLAAAVASAPRLRGYPVSSLVNRPANDGPELLRPLD